MIVNENHSDPSPASSSNDQPVNLPGYPLYPDNEDIFNKFHEETAIDPEETSQLKVSAERDGAGAWNEKDFSVDKTGEDLDVPGSEADDAAENNGSEDEENNYYSIGGDNHDNLEENY